MNRRQYIVEMIAKLIEDSIKAELVVERLEEEGVLHLGYGDADIDIVLESFVQAFGTTKTSKNDRWAANRLVKKYSAQAVVGIINLLAANTTQKYAPVPNSVVQLEEKWVSILNFLRSIKGNEEIQL